MKVMSLVNVLAAVWPFYSRRRQWL